MKYPLSYLAVVSILFFSGCSQHRIQTIDSNFYSSDGSHVAKALTDTVTFEQEVEGHLSMPDSVQTEIRGLAENELVDWRDFEEEVQDSYESIYRRWFQAGNVRRYDHRGVGLGNSLVALREATNLDPAFPEAWSLSSDAEREAGWRPGGWELVAYHEASKRLFVLMHRGGEWTHKKPGTEVWVLDVAQQKRVNRIELATPASSIAVSQGPEQVQLYAMTKNVLTTYDASSGEVIGTLEQMGGTPLEIVVYNR